MSGRDGRHAPGLRVLGGVIAAATALAAGAGVRTFPDLDGHWARPAVTALAARGQVSGFPDGTFRPEAPVTRAEFTKLLVLATGAGAGLPAGQPPFSRFPDVRGHWAQGYVEAAAESGLVMGYSDGLFRPDGRITRQEAIVVAARALGLEAPGDRALPFPDSAGVAEWARGPIAAAEAAGLLRGLVGERLDPLRPATRAEAAVLTARVAARAGGLYDLTGEVRGWDARTRTLTLRTPADETRRLEVAPDAWIFRNGEPASDFRTLDQVWVLLDPAGRVGFAEARYEDLLGTQAVFRDGAVQIAEEGAGRVRQVPVGPGTRVFVNGRPAEAAQVDGAQLVYVVLDPASGEARVVDAVRYNHRGRIARVDRATQRVWLLEEGPVALRVPPDALLYQDGRPVQLERLHIGETAVALAEGDLLRFLQVEPPAGNAPAEGSGAGAERQ
ncbi:S-layer homology domain-containing protein [Caldinitratiruptor microaerophilus]|uniref:SLH domain-containing protein n=1 Tax=Caldinitratiruptor microaerophilus TaxID=671077 RepID=A0AA35CMD1_9FIRM|nr:S-layer homology domain-containing protein [Caldinitratiruptor microaerophilus]BDG61792.1 hypothetical protein caldi_28820 [Caldinitratiruptor microaerophilus]